MKFRLFPTFHYYKHTARNVPVAMFSCTSVSSLGYILRSRIDGWSATHMFHFIFPVVSELWLRPKAEDKRP